MEHPEIDQNYLQELFVYSDGNLIWKNTSGRHNCAGKVAGRLTPYGYVSVEVNGKPHQAHRLIWVYHNGNTDFYIDHINGIRSDNRIENLRPCTKTQNAHNRKKCKRNSTGVKGIRLRSDSGKFEARITLNKKRVVLGSYENLEFAELVVIMAREKYHGDFANHG